MQDPQFFSIGEFSQIVGLSVKALRFYDEKGLLQPARVDPATSYRYYNAALIERARIIAQLRTLQFPLDEIARILANCDDDAGLLDHMEKHRRNIVTRLRADRKTLKSLDSILAAERAAVRLASEGIFAIKAKEVPSLIVAGLRMEGRYSDCGRGFATVARAMGRHITGKPLCLYYDGEYRDDDATFEACFPVRTNAVPTQGIDLRTLPAVSCITVIYQGPYPQIGHAYRIVLAEAGRRGLRVDLPTREVYLKGPGMIFRGSPAKYLTEIQLPVSQA